MIKEELITKMTELNAGDPKQIQHLIKVYEFAHTIGVKECIDQGTLHILDIASIMHDIGIKPAREKYGNSNGKLQEQEGPAYAKIMLGEFKDISDEEINRVCYLIAHHHTYEEIDGIDYQILLEADFLVNAFEDRLEKEEISHFRNKIFKTKTGIYLLNTMFGLE